MSLNVHNTTLQTLFSIYVSLLLGVVLIPNCISLLQCFQLTGLRLSFFLICDPPRPRTVWLVHRSVVPYRSLFSLRHFCLLVPSLSTLNWPLGPATVCRSSRGSLLIDQTYPSPSDLSLTGYFTAQASFLPGGFFHALHALVFLLLSVFWLRFLGRLFRRHLFAARMHATGYLGGRIAPCRFQPPCCTHVFLPHWSGTVFLGGALLFRRPPGCRQPHFAQFLARPVVPALATSGYLSVRRLLPRIPPLYVALWRRARQWRLPRVAFLTPFRTAFLVALRGLVLFQPFIPGTSLS